MPETLAPGLGRLCGGCGNFLPALHRQGHPSPCARFRWVGIEHISPDLTRGPAGESCLEFRRAFREAARA